MWSFTSFDARPIASCGVIAALVQTSSVSFHRVIHFAHRRMDRVDGNVSDRQIFVEVAVRSDIAAAVLHPKLQLEFSAFAHRRDVNVLVQHGNVRIFFDLRGRNRSRRIHHQRNRLGLVGVQLQRHLLQVQNDVGRVFHHARNRREFVQHAFNLHRGNGRAFNRAQQRPAQRISDRGSPAALKRLR